MEETRIIAVITTLSIDKISSTDAEQSKTGFPCHVQLGRMPDKHNTYYTGREAESCRIGEEKSGVIFKP